MVSGVNVIFGSISKSYGTGPAGGLRYYKEHTWLSQPNTPAARAEQKKFLREWSPTPLAFSSFPKELVRLPLE